MARCNGHPWQLAAAAAFWLLFSTPAAASPEGAASPAGAAGNVVYITHVTVIDTLTGTQAPDRTVIVSGERILAVGSSSKAPPPAAAHVVDGSGKYLIPGLWDMHVHGNNQPWFASFFPLYLANGVTGIREMFGPPSASGYRDALRALRAAAPQVYLASPIVDGDPPAWPASITVTSAAEARRVVGAQQAQGADFIKVYEGLPRDAYFALLAEARRRHVPVAGHVPIRVTAWEALASGQQTLEHLSGVALACSTRESALQAEFRRATSALERDKITLQAMRSYSHETCLRLFARLKARSAWPVPTLVVQRSFAMLDDAEFRGDQRIRYFGGEARDWLVAKDDARLKDYSGADFAREREAYAYFRMLVGELYRAGVPMLAGTDVGNPYVFAGFSLHDELALLVESGASPLAALQAATSNAAKLMHAGDRYGSVAPGKIADLVLLDADPLADIRNTTRIAAVVVAGHVHDRAALDAMLRGAADAAAGIPPQRSADASALTELACETGRAYARRDIATLERLSADDYRQTDVRGGVLARSDWLEFVRNRQSELRIDCDDVAVRFYGDAAVVTGRWAYTRLAADGNALTQTRWTSVWTRTGAGWQRHAFQNTYVNANADRCAATPPPP